MNIQFKYGYDFIGYNAPTIVIPSGSMEIFHHRSPRRNERCVIEQIKKKKKKKETKKNIYIYVYIGCSTLDKKITRSNNFHRPQWPACVSFLWLNRNGSRERLINSSGLGWCSPGLKESRISLKAVRVYHVWWTRHRHVYRIIFKPLTACW